ncbi:MAG: Flp pilus assembly protein CpaB, partial [Xanthobacteraceae bacterium]|nr:Flp pilus assembly protein CpaB [Xanthobacteraceae bacterium]
YSDILLHHVKVLAIDQFVNERQEQPTVPKAVTLEVTPEQAQKVLLAANIGKLSLTLRQPADRYTEAGRRVTERDLGRAELRPPEPPRAVAVAASPPPPPPPVAAPPPPTTVKVIIVRNMKREEYTVRREGR